MAVLGLVLENGTAVVGLLERDSVGRGEVCLAAVGVIDVGEILVIEAVVEVLGCYLQVASVSLLAMRVGSSSGG